MADPETPLQMAQRHVASQEVLIAKQRTLIERLEQQGHATGAANEMLGTMQGLLETYQSDLDRLSGRD